MRPIAPPKILSQVDWDKDCQRELLSGDDDSCVFTDIDEFWASHLKHVVAGLMRSAVLALEILAGPVVSGGSVVLSANCLRHSHITGKKCTLRCARRHIAGTPCAAFSLQGLQLGASDPRIVFFMCWVALRLALQEAEIIQENVRQFPTSLIARFLGGLYFIDYAIIDPTELGWRVEHGG